LPVFIRSSSLTPLKVLFVVVVVVFRFSFSTGFVEERWFEEQDNAKVRKSKTKVRSGKGSPQRLENEKPKRKVGDARRGREGRRGGGGRGEGRR
jgi:hypothetical protein